MRLGEEALGAAGIPIHPQWCIAGLRSVLCAGHLGSSSPLLHGANFVHQGIVIHSYISRNFGLYSEIHTLQFHNLVEQIHLMACFWNVEKKTENPEETHATMPSCHQRDFCLAILIRDLNINPCLDFCKAAL